MVARKEVQSWKQKRAPAELGLCVGHLFPSDKRESLYFDRLFLLLTALWRLPVFHVVSHCAHVWGQPGPCSLAVGPGSGQPR